jgi:hydroxypyruvate isomerase
MRRRDFVTALAAANAAAAQTSAPSVANSGAPVQRKGRIKQSVMRANFDPKMPLDDICREAARLGAKGFDLAGPNDWPTLKKYGLIPTMAGSPASFKDGMIRPELHDALEKSFGTAIDGAAAAGCPNVITVGGQRRGMSNEEGADHAVAFLHRIKAHAEDRNTTICMEIMNSRLTPDTVGRLDQMCDHVAWGAGVVKRVNSPRVKILFDIYHVQIMYGGIVRNIRDNFQWIGHFRFAAQAIAELGFTGYIAHEHRSAPGRDPLKSLDQAIGIMDV